MGKKLLSVLNRCEEVALISMFLAMVVIIFFQVIMRYVFNNSLTWSEELGKFLFVWISWLGISIGARRGEHIKITMLVDRLPFKMAQIINIVSELIVIAICAITTFYAIQLVIGQSAAHYAGIKISLSWGYSAVVVGCTLMILRCIISIADSKQKIKDGPGEQVTEKGGLV